MTYSTCHLIDKLLSKLLVVTHSSGSVAVNPLLLSISFHFISWLVFIVLLYYCLLSFLIFSERELKFTFAICYRPSVCLSSVCLSSVVCNVRAPYSGDWNFRQCFYAMWLMMWYLGHPWPLYKNFTEIVPGELLRRGVKPKRGSQI